MNINSIIYLIFIVIILYLSGAFIHKQYQYNMVKTEKAEIESLLAQANASIKIQNYEIQQMKSNVEQAEYTYKAEMDKLNKKYEKYSNVSANNKLCSEILNQINLQQKEYLNEK